MHVLHLLLLAVNAGLLLTIPICWFRTRRLLRGIKAKRREIRRDVQISERINTLAEITEAHRLALQGMNASLDYIVGHVCDHVRVDAQRVVRLPN